MTDMHRVFWVAWTAGPEDRIDCTDWFEESFDAFKDAKKRIPRSFKSPMLIVWLAKVNDEVAHSRLIINHLIKIHDDILSRYSDRQETKSGRALGRQANLSQPAYLKQKGVFHLYIHDGSRRRFLST